MATEIKIRDYSLFHDVVKAMTKLTNAAKFQIGPDGLEVYGKNVFARGEFTTNSVYSDEPVEFCLDDVSLLLKILTSVGEIHKDESDMADLHFMFDSPHVRIESKKFKTKINTRNESVIENFISKKITTKMEPVLEFSTTSDTIKYINQHSFIFSNLSMARIYIATNPEMENNTIYATIGNNETDLNNSITLKLGLVTFGSDEGRTIILDFDRLNIFNIVQSDDIKIQLMDRNALIYKAQFTGKNESYFNMLVCSSMLAK